jgi:hypothetical protein
MNERAKADALAACEAAFDDVEALVGDLTAEQLERPVFTGEGEGWRVRDLIAHLAAWQARGAQAARRVAREGLQPTTADRARTLIGLTESVDDINAGTHRVTRDRSAARSLADLRAAHAELMDALRALTPAQLLAGDSVNDMYLAFRAPAYEHLQKHGAHINAALANEGVRS